MQPVILLKNIRVTQGENFSLSVENLALQPASDLCSDRSQRFRQKHPASRNGVIALTRSRDNRILRQQATTTLPSSGKESPWWNRLPICSMAR